MQENRAAWTSAPNNPLRATSVEFRAQILRDPGRKFPLWPRSPPSVQFISLALQVQRDLIELRVLMRTQRVALTLGVRCPRDQPTGGLGTLLERMLRGNVVVVPAWRLVRNEGP